MLRPASRIVHSCLRRGTVRSALLSRRLPTFGCQYQLNNLQPVGRLYSVLGSDSHPAEPHTHRPPCDELIEDYPLLLTDGVRKSTFEPVRSWWPWWDRLLLIPGRRYVAKLTTWGWMQSRFATEDATQPPYFPEMFSEGARFAFTSLIQRLSKWDGSSLDNDLNKLLTPALYSRFKAKHEELDAQGLMMKFHLEADLPTPDVGEVWLTFGPASIVRSTVMGGTVVKWFNPLGFVRQLPNKKDSYLFREVVFEFALEDDDMPGGPKVAPAMPLRAQAIKQGQIVGVDVAIDTKLRITVREKANPAVIVSEKFVDRPVALRFDSSHFTEKMDGEWRVADVDRLLQHELTEHAEAQLRDGRA